MAHELISRGGEQHSGRLLQVPRSVSSQLDEIYGEWKAVRVQTEGYPGSAAVLRCFRDFGSQSWLLHGFAFRAREEGGVDAVHQWYGVQGSGDGSQSALHEEPDLTTRSKDAFRGSAGYKLMMCPGEEGNGSDLQWRMLGSSREGDNRDAYSRLRGLYSLGPRYDPAQSGVTLGWLHAMAVAAGREGLFTDPFLAEVTAAVVGNYSRAERIVFGLGRSANNPGDLAGRAYT